MVICVRVKAHRVGKALELFTPPPILSSFTRDRFVYVVNLSTPVSRRRVCSVVASLTPDAFRASRYHFWLAYAPCCTPRPCAPNPLFLSILNHGLFFFGRVRPFVDSGRFLYASMRPVAILWFARVYATRLSYVVCLI